MINLSYISGSYASSQALHCPVCNSAGFPEQTTSDAVVWRCPACDHCFSDLQSIEAHEVYSQEYFDVTHRKWFANPDVGLFEKIANFIQDQQSVVSLLDVGCGNGNFLRHLSKKNLGISLTGIDVADNKYSEGFAFIKGDALRYQFDRTFDIVTSIAVIEHIADVNRFIKRLKDLCSPGGVIIITTINDRSVLYTAARFFRKLGFAAPSDRLYSKHHLNHFNINSLAHLVASHKLLAVKTVKHNAPLNAIDFTSSSPLLSAFLRIGVWKAFMLGSLTGKTYQQTIICKKLG